MPKVFRQTVIGTFFLVIFGAASSLKSFESSTLGIIAPVRSCGGGGQFAQWKVDGMDCLNGNCTFQPGTSYSFETDFRPSGSATSLSLMTDICNPSNGLCHTVLLAVVPGSEVAPGVLYTLRHNFIPNDTLRGQVVEIRLYVFHTIINYMEICAAIDARLG